MGTRAPRDVFGEPSSGGCPVIHGAGADEPAAAAAAAAAGGGGGCPVISPSAPASPTVPAPGTPSSNRPLAGQAKPLSTWRQQSSIPTVQGASLPAHQGAVDEGASSSACPACDARRAEATAVGSSEGVAVGDLPSACPMSQGDPDASTWVYPSEQMFFNAMRRKGWEPSEDDMSAVVAIHNAVNERAWYEILRWEDAHWNGPSGQDGRGPRSVDRRPVDPRTLPCGGPQLARFTGRPQDWSPKARLLNALGYKLPFDRHDWYVDRCGKRVRYVIDFYNAAPLPNMPAAVHLDVRPALDDPSAVWDRLRMQAAWIYSGLFNQE